MKINIVTLTINPALDKITEIEHVAPNKKLRCNPPGYQAGGGGINVSRAISLLGGTSLAIFPCGGYKGEFLKEKLDTDNIQYRSIPIQGATRENFTIFEEGADQAFRFIMPGPTLNQEEFEHILDAIRTLDPVPDFLVASGSIPRGVPVDFYQQIAEIAKDIGCKLIVDTSGEPLKMAAKVGVFLLKPNLRELGYLAGCEIESEEQEIEAAQKLINMGDAEVVVVSLGAGGALLVTEKRVEHLRTPTVPIRSKLGAGDSMVAGIVLRLSEGKPIREATLYGIAAGAATVMTPGVELCSKKDTDRLYQNLSS